MRKEKSNQTPVWGSFATLVWCFLIFLCYIGVQLVTYAVYFYSVHGMASFEQFTELSKQLKFDGLLFSLSAIVSSIICTPVIFGIIKLKRHSSIKEYLGLKAIKIKTAGSWLLVLLVFLAVSDIITWLLGRPIVPEFVTETYLSTENKAFLWAALLLAAPLFEEIAIRGFVIKGLAASYLKPAGAVLITSFIWSVMHIQYDLYGMVSIFILGTLLGIARLKTGSVYLTIGMHSLVNLVAGIEALIVISRS